MYKHGIKLLPQEFLGYYLGLVVKPENRKLFWNPRVGKRPSSGWGTQIGKKEFEPNRVFKKLGIPLAMKIYPTSTFNKSSFGKFLKEAVKKDRDVLVCFDHGELNGTHIQGGHVCVVDRVDTKDDTVRLIDPQQNQPKRRTVKMGKLFKAMQFHGDVSSAGLWVFKKI